MRPDTGPRPSNAACFAGSVKVTRSAAAAKLVAQQNTSSIAARTRTRMGSAC